MDHKDPLALYEDRLNAVDRRRWLRPMLPSEVLETASRIYQIKGRAILPRTFLYSAVAYLGLSFFFAFSAPGLFGINAGKNFGADAAEGVIALLLGLVFAIPAAMYGMGSSFAIAMGEAEPAILGEPERPARPEEDTGLWKVTGLLTLVALITLAPMLIAGAAISIGAWLETAGSDLSILFGVLGWFMLIGALPVSAIVGSRLAVSPAVFLRERRTLVQSIKRSWNISKGSKNLPSAAEPGIYIFVCSGFLLFAIMGMISIAIEFLSMQPVVDSFLNGAVWGQFGKAALESLPGFFAIWLVTPFLAIAITVLYFDRLIRLEAFDIRVLARDVMEVRS